ncbi:MAG: helix-turn-helix domain-containing protein [Paraclostridium sp.]
MIKSARKKHNLTQKELALRCNLSQSYVSKLENRTHCNLTLYKIKRISKVLNIDLVKLFKWLSYYDC